MTSTTNRERTCLAANALLELRDATGCNYDEALTDMLTDLMHWASHKGRDFEQALDTARIHFDAEARP